LANRIKASAFIETSAKNNDNVTDLFIAAAKQAVIAKNAKRKRKFNCSFL